MGALKATTFKYYWNGTDEQKEAVTDRMLRMYYDYQEQTGCMDCEQIIDCILNDDDTQDAIAAAINANTSIQEAINDVYNSLQQGGFMPASVTGAAITGSNPECDLNTLWGWIDGGIEGMNANNIDAQQIAESQSNVFERIASISSAIPGIGVLPVDEILSYIQGLWSDDLFEAYEANDTTEYRRTLKCDIFCLARANDCKVTLDLLEEYFKGRLSYTGGEVLQELIEFLAGGTWTGTLVNDTFYLAQLLWLKYGNQYFKVLGLMGISTMFRLGEPSDDWELLCEECPTEWCYEWDFAAGETTDWTIQAGQFITDVGYQNDTGSGFPYTTDIIRAMSDWGDSTLTEIRIFASVTTADATGVKGAYYPPSGVTDFTPNTETGDIEAVIAVTVPQPVNVAVQVSNNTTPGTNTITKVRMSGAGDLPAWMTGGTAC